MHSKRLAIIFLFCCLFAHTGRAQTIFDNPIIVRQLGLTIDYIYNLEFEKADPFIDKLHPKLHDHPSYYLLNAFYTYWKEKPLKIGNADFNKFEGQLLKTIELCDSIFAKDEDNIEAGFFSMAAHAYLALLYVENDENLKAMGEAKASYNYIIDGFDLLDKYPEYYFPCGIYNYYREKYPEEHPFFKPFVWVFRSGDKEEGIRLLKKGVTESIFAKVESMNYLSHIYLHYEDNVDDALYYARMLNRQYPNNPTFTTRLAEVYLAKGQYQKASPLTETLITNKDRYFMYIGMIFKGIALEATSSDNEKTLNVLKSADLLGDQLDMRDAHHDSQLYLSLGNVNMEIGNNEQARHYYKKALKNSEYSIMSKKIRSAMSELE